MIKAGDLQHGPAMPGRVVGGNGPFARPAGNLEVTRHPDHLDVLARLSGPAAPCGCVRPTTSFAGPGRWTLPQGLGSPPICFPSPQAPGDDGWHVEMNVGDSSDFMK